MQQPHPLLAVVLLAACAQLAGAQNIDDGLVLQPRAHIAPAPKPKPTTLLIKCDLACIWTLDSKPQGRIEAENSARAVVDPGQHLLLTCTEDGQDTSRQTVQAKAATQTSLQVELKPIHDARLEQEQARRDAEERARQQEVERQKQLARQQELERQREVARQQEIARQQEAERQQQVARQQEAERQQQLARQQQSSRQQDLRQLAADHLRQGVALYRAQRFAEARPLFASACDGANVEACNWLGFLYDHGQGVTTDYVRALSLYRSACETGVMPACNNLGYLFEHGRGVPVDYERARMNYQRACQFGDSLGCFHLGKLMEQGNGVPRNMPRARALYLRACTGGEQAGCQAVRSVR
jgi:TPR repeat protein